MTSLLPVDAARAAVLAAVTPLGTEEVPLAQALGRVLARDVRAGGDVPPFRNSAMDGFAVAAGPADRRLRIVGESRAGSPAAVALGPGDAVRISTGAAVPDGADAVVMVERTEEHPDGTVTVHDEATPDRNVRGVGEDLRAGTVAVPAGTTLGPAALGVAATAGVAHVTCARRPRVALLATGDELVPIGEPLPPGGIHDSNAVALAGYVALAGGEVVSRTRTPDTAEATRAAIREALADADVLISTGGVSVGAHDHVKDALAAAGVEERFWRVALRPGKPTWFGVRGEQLVLGLPGNPVSAMVTFLLFARPALLVLQGAPALAPRDTAVLTRAVPRHAVRDEMVRVTLDGDRATPTGPQGSHVMTSMLAADALALVPMGEGELPAGAEVAVERL
ncbi:molybdopterin molybdotransferase MoeA [Paraconexibacter algicola]|uniref:Molybdopterin molybdenumtransferase n=1 Tax=Paraconexibacter algicola TaxID=2133960 RepID=A0A2T4UMI9_9ACTN|nr:gephyrin-like molybdotransferase Glp [Paraconexibacter algicola]PTL60467.1 molybdopterin molybdenumtransferase MoeA [Paraconexibacter algicola]